MSRSAALLLLPFAPLWAPELGAAQTLTAEDAYANYRQRFAPVAELDCPRKPEDEITVCAKRSGPDRDRLPLPVEPAPGTRIAGELPRASSARGPGTERCSTVGPNQQCGGGLPVIQGAILLFRIAKKLAEGDD